VTEASSPLLLRWIRTKETPGVYGAARRYMEDKEDSKGVKFGLFKRVGQRISLVEGIIQFLKVYTEKTPDSAGD